jgi:thymidylate synthase
MTQTIHAQDLSSGWLSAIEYLLTCGGKDTNIIVVIEQVEREYIGIRHLLDTFTNKRREQKGTKLYPVNTVANTLFPQALYYPERGDNARSFLYKTHEQSFSIEKRLRANQRGTYFHRMVAWSGKHHEVNQLELVITRLRQNLQQVNPLSSAYEIGVSEVEEHMLDEALTEEVRIYEPGRDNSIRGFPCLSHISLTLVKKQLHLTALYRNQQFISRAYGNYLGLSRLLRFFCQEIGCEPGEIVCIASHADAELHLNKSAITELIRQCKALLVANENIYK